MNKEEIKEYLKRVDELELKLTGEDKDTYQWLLFGYNECARLLNEKEYILKELRSWLEEYYDYSDCIKIKSVLKKLNELESGKND
jgi:hypothetical protein